ncbi:MAG: HAMP domain-containing histidine kinase [Clostridiales bacterium]|jgi:signal transduction histidine kinase|nr:HAMP domain-containing histidine kinase [Clostridiales bacterium]
MTDRRQPPAETPAAVNYEEVDSTLLELRAQRAARQDRRRPPAYYIFFPFVKLGEGGKYLLSRFKLPLTLKTTLIFTLLFTAVCFAVNFYIIGNIERQFAQENVAGYEAYMRDIRLTSALLILIAVAVVVALGSLASQAMIRPMRRMIEKLDEITGETLSTRLDEVDAQDELRELTAQINEMLDDLEDAFDRQKKFVSDASHELKTPISVIKGYAELLQRWGKDDPEILQEGIDSIAGEAENMKRIVEQLLFLAKIGRFSFAPSVFNLSAELKNIAYGYGLVYPERNFTFSGGKTVTVSMDKNMLTQVVRAIADNAVKYSDEGTGVTFSLTALRSEADPEAEPTVSIGIKDRGYGIAEADLPLIFDRFYRCDRVRSREKNSSGLGLTIAKTIVEKMGGTLTVSSTVGKGSVFTISLPAGINEEEADAE